MVSMFGAVMQFSVLEGPSKIQMLQQGIDLRQFPNNAGFI
jgi:hypothetical protein